jgi:glycosyltransferase involved in cell wall biosynthesis
MLPETAARLTALLTRMIQAGDVAAASGLYFVDDGSQDDTWRLICDFAAKDNKVNGIKLSRNRGHQNALLCGLLTVPGDAVVSMDADLQDDPEAIPAMIADYRAGSEIVYAVRSNRATDGIFKRESAGIYYRMLRLFGVRIPFNHADFRLMSRRAVEALHGYGESHLFLRALVPQLGFASSEVQYARQARRAGQSKYPLRKMMSFAWEGVTSFTAYPLRLITTTGLVVSAGSLLIAIWALVIRLFTDRAVPGWASIVIPTYFIGGVQLLSLGVIGEYLAKVYESTKQRPRYCIEVVCGESFVQR